MCWVFFFFLLILQEKLDQLVVQEPIDWVSSDQVKNLRNLDKKATCLIPIYFMKALSFHQQIKHYSRPRNPISEMIFRITNRSMKNLPRVS